jgi:hypothetical protein
MPERDKLLFQTNLELEKTLERLRTIPDVRVEYEKGMDPRGIAWVYWNDVKAQISTGGVVQLYAFRKDFKDALDFLQSNAVDRNGGLAVWAQPTEYVGKDSLLEQNRILREAVGEGGPVITDSFNENYKVRNLQGFYVEKAEIGKVQAPISEGEDIRRVTIDPWNYEAETPVGQMFQFSIRGWLTCPRGHRNSPYARDDCETCGTSLRQSGF